MSVWQANEVPEGVITRFGLKYGYYRLKYGNTLTIKVSTFNKRQLDD